MFASLKRTKRLHKRRSVLVLKLHDCRTVVLLLAFRAMRLSMLMSLLAVSVVVVVTDARRSQQSGGRYDVLLINGRIVDGTGAPWFRGDVGISGDRIAAIGSLKDAAAAVRI